MKVTYYALKPIKVGDELRQPGDLIPEAQTWKWIHTYIKDAKIAPVLVASLPRATQDKLRQWEEDQETFNQIVEEGVKNG